MSGVVWILHLNGVRFIYIFFFFLRDLKFPHRGFKALTIKNRYEREIKKKNTKRKMKSLRLVYELQRRKKHRQGLGYDH